MEQKILIVDDEAHIRMLIEQTLEELEDEGVEFLTAENGEIALDIIQKENPKLVFLDVMMPKMNGMEVCRRVKKELGLDNVFIVLLTAKARNLIDKEDKKLAPMFI
jgi:CheY-like chemotaxis protein